MNEILLVSVALRLLGAGYSLLLLSRSRDPRPGFLTLMLSFMALRQLLTIQTANAGIEELPGLIVSVLTILTVYYLSKHVDEEATIKRELQRANDRLRGSGRQSSTPATPSSLPTPTAPSSTPTRPSSQ